MENIIHEELARCKAVIKDNKDALERLVNALVEKDSLDIIKIKNILGPKPFPEDDMIKKVIEEVAK